MSTPKVTFGVVNCNRLYYLRSCVESLLISTADFPSKELIVVDNASVEAGTEEYLSELEDRGFTVIRQKERDPSNEFARGLNTICRLAKGEFIVPLQGDMQFVLEGGWLAEYVRFAEAHADQVGSIILNAQRRSTNESHTLIPLSTEDEPFKFVLDMHRDPVAGAGDVFYSRAVIDRILPWSESNQNHEGGKDSETRMLEKVARMKAQGEVEWKPIQPVISPAITINTDPRGTNARVRKNRRYGQYWSPKEDSYRYYEMIPFEIAVETYADRAVPVGIEELVRPVGFKPFLDEWGAWLKNPIRPETASSDDWVELDDPSFTSSLEGECTDDPEFLDWLQS